MKKEAPENEASHFSHGLREAVFLFQERASCQNGDLKYRPPEVCSPPVAALVPQERKKPVNQS
jgi:hypothetical protein